jgi:hypothetical protein
VAEFRGPDPNTAITIGGIQCWDEDTEESFDREATDRSGYANRTILTAWGDRLRLAQQLLGGTRISSGSNGTTQTLTTVPAAYPDLIALKAMSFKVGGVGRRVQSSTLQVGYEWSRNVIGYRYPKFSAGADQNGDALEIGSEELDFSSSSWAMASDQASFRWTSDSKDVPASVAPSFKVTTVAFTKEVRGYARLPMATIMDCIDCSNSGSFLGASAEQIIFRGGRSRRRITTAGFENWDCTFFFEFFKQGWNKLFRPGTGWADFEKKGGGKFFETRNLGALLTRAA